jgi:hypothetical protein
LGVPGTQQFVSQQAEKVTQVAQTAFTEVRKEAERQGFDVPHTFEAASIAPGLPWPSLSIRPTSKGARS